jgi:hypothetical protein
MIPSGSKETKLAEKSLIEKGIFGDLHMVLRPDRPETVSPVVPAKRRSARIRRGSRLAQG